MKLHAQALLLLAIFPVVVSAQQTRNPLTDAQRSGQRLYNRECAVCHAPPLITAKPYASALYKDVVEGKEQAVRQTIRKGLPGLMPGFEYGLKASEIDAIVEYLKTVPKPAPSAATGESDKRAD